MLVIFDGSTNCSSLRRNKPCVFLSKFDWLYVAEKGFK